MQGDGGGGGREQRILTMPASAGIIPHEEPLASDSTSCTEPSKAPLALTHEPT